MPSVNVYAGAADANLPNNWTNSVNVRADDNTWATATNSGVAHKYASFVFDFSAIPGNAVVTSAVLQVEWKVDTTLAAATLRAECGTASGATFTPNATYTITDATEPTAAAGVQRTLQCIALGWAALTNANFRVRLDAENASAFSVDASVDYLRFVVTYTASDTATVETAAVSVDGLAATASVSCDAVVEPAAVSLAGFPLGCSASSTATTQPAAATAVGHEVFALATPWSLPDPEPGAWADKAPASSGWSDQTPTASTWTDNPSTPWG